MAKIYAPNKNYTGVSASVSFVQGVGETDSDYLLKWFANHGYTVVDEAAEADAAAKAEADAKEKTETEAAAKAEAAKAEEEPAAKAK